uniref:Coiled-coil domain containing 112 n=1 Tax=Taeniopygia guttata TaxID=59729 RepID=A0A674GES4_TAEGU
IEKEKTGHLCNRKNDFRVEYRLLEELEHSMTVSRKMEKAEILQQLSKIQNNVKRLQQQLKDVKPTPECKFLQRTGGRQGGWDDYDHQNFLKIGIKYRGRLSYMDEALKHLSGKTKEDTEQHDKWYQEYVILHERKKESVKKWKEKQQQEKERNFQEKEKSEKMLKERWLQHEEAQKQKAEEERKRKQAWKKQKVVAYAIDQASQLKLEEKTKKQQMERQSHVKLLLERNTLQKTVKEELEKLENEKKEAAEKEGRKKIAAEEISKFQEHDLHKLELSILQKHAKEIDKQERKKRLAKLREKVEVQVTKDGSTLNRPSKGWEERRQEMAPAAAEPLLRVSRR